MTALLLPPRECLFDLSRTRQQAFGLVAKRARRGEVARDALGIAGAGMQAEEIESKILQRRDDIR